jgi:hypothetical protein
MVLQTNGYCVEGEAPHQAKMVVSPMVLQSEGDGVAE